MARGKKSYGVTPWGARLRAQLTSMGGRIERGEALARTGKVFDTEIRGGRVRSRVRGTMAPFYDVSCAWEPAGPDAPQLARDAVARDLNLTAELVAGSLPIALLDTLEEAGVRILPQSYEELHGDCNCPDNMAKPTDRPYYGGTRKRPGEPCKHQAALMFELIGELDKNPSTLLALRGININSILGVAKEGDCGTNATELAYPIPVATFQPAKEEELGIATAPEPGDAKAEETEVKPEEPVKGRRRSMRVKQLAAQEEVKLVKREPEEMSLRPIADEKEFRAVKREPEETSPHLAAPCRNAAITFPKLASSARVILQTLSPKPMFSKEDFQAVLRDFYAALSDKKTIQQIMEPEEWEADLDVDSVRHVVERSRLNLVLSQSLSVRSAHVVMESDLWDNGFSRVSDEGGKKPAKNRQRKKKKASPSSVDEPFSEDQSLRVAKTPAETLSTIPFEEIDARGKSGTTQVKLTLDTCRRLLLRLPSNGFVGSQSFCFFSNVVRVASLLFASANFVPDVVPLPSCGSWTVVWRPFASNNAVSKCMRILEHQHPSTYAVVYLRSKGGPVNGLALNPSSAVVHSLSAFLTDLVSDVEFYKGKTKSAERLSFFENEPYSSVNFSDKSNGIVVKRWLSVFGLLSMQAEILLKLEEPTGTEKDSPFAVELYFRDTRNDLSRDDSAVVSSQSKMADDDAADTKTVNSRNVSNVSAGLRELGWNTPDSYMATGSQQSSDAIKFVVALKDYIPEVQRLIQTGRARISTQEFERFILEKSGALRALGTSLVLPRGIKQILRPRIVKEVSLDTSGTTLSWRKQYLQMASLMQFNYKVIIGDDVVDVHEFQRMVDSGKRLFHFKGKYVELDPKNVANILQMSKESPRAEEVGLGLLRDLVSGNPEYIMTQDVAELVAGIHDVQDVDLPSSVTAQLRGYQVTGFKWMMSNLNALGGCALLDDMGLGKTVQTISVIASLKDSGLTDDNPCVVVCPSSLISNWKREFRRFAPSVSVTVIAGPKRAGLFQSCVGKKRRRGTPDVLLMSYVTLRTDVAALSKHMFSLIVLDEAQYIKNHSSQIAKACKKVGAKCGMRLALTGTVVENRLAELHACFDFILPTYLGKLKFFVDRFSKPIERDRDQDALEQLRRMTAPFMLRRLKTDPSVISDLPDKVETKQFMSLSPEQIALYESVREETFNILEDDAPLGSGIKRSGLILKLLTSLKQICNHPASFGDKPDDISPERSEKCMALFDLLNPIVESGEKVLIFSQYVRMCRILEKQVADQFGLRALVYEGSLSQAKRDEVVRSFERDPAKQILILSLKAGGVGLNLTAANHCIMFDRWYNPSVEAQATDRAFRIGQRKKVFVHKFVCSDTFEMKIDEMIEQKREISNLSVGQGEAWIGKMSDDELRDLFSLSKTDS